MAEKIATVSTKDAPAAIGPYSQAKIAGGFLFASGQIAINPETGEIDGTDIRAQAERVMKNIGALLAAAGAGYDDVVRTECFLADMGDFAEFNDVYGSYFPNRPARSCVAVRTLPKNVLCEVEITAWLGDQ
ncbi:MAG: Rid family detoxifying hydrolase [Lachnospiraceae bacterium]|nr:Rid family detoxifying hydrolase [Lachnospiraceae bacterium]